MTDDKRCRIIHSRGINPQAIWRKKDKEGCVPRIIKPDRCRCSLSNGHLGDCEIEWMGRNKYCIIWHAMGTGGEPQFKQCLLEYGHEGDCEVEWMDRKWLVSPKGFYDHPPIEVSNAI